MTDAAEERAPHAVDAHVGRRIRELRHRQHVSQEQLAQALGLTFQQVQKYERGTNRVSASKLFEVAWALGVDVAYFFRGLQQSVGSASEVDAGAPGEDSAAVTAEAAEIDRLFLRMGSRQRRLVVEMARALSAGVRATSEAERSGDVEPPGSAVDKELEAEAR